MESLCQECADPEGSMMSERTWGDHSVLSAIRRHAEEVIRTVKASGGMGITNSFPSQGHMCKGTMETGKSICVPDSYESQVSNLWRQRLWIHQAFFSYIFTGLAGPGLRRKDFMPPPESLCLSSALRTEFHGLC